MKQCLGYALLSSVLMMPCVQAEVNTPNFDGKKIDSYIQKNLPNASVGIILLEAESGKVLYEQRAFEPFPPASTTKLFTTAAALLTLGPEYQYETVLKIEKNALKNNSIRGNLYVQLSGDPSLTEEDLKNLLSTLKTKNITKIQGDIVIEANRFQPPFYAMGWPYHSLPWYFAQPVTAAIINQNTVKVTIDSNKKLGEKASVALAPLETTPLKINQNVTIVTERMAETECQLEVQMDPKNKLSISGCWPIRPTPDILKLALANPVLLIEEKIKEALKAEKIAFFGKVQSAITPAEAEILVVHRSLPLHTLIKPLLQDSNNLYAESLLKTMGVKQFQTGTFQAGVRAVAAVLTKPTGIDFSQLKLFDGSGLSTYNLISPHQIGQLLFAMHHDKKVGQFFKEALPIASELGTLKGRLGTSEVAGQIRAKTGSLAHASALGGYLKTRNQKELIFVIMVDHFLEDIKTIKQFEDELCRLFEHYN